MISLTTFLAFFAASLALALAPGPDNIFVLTQSALYGRKAGWLITLGLCTGLLGHTTAVVIGVAAIIKASALAFTILKLAGAGYLLYLAWQAFRAPASAIVVSSESAAGPDGARLYRRGIIMNLTNPKVSIFFLAFLPQFVDPARGGVALQMIALGATFILATILVFGGIAIAAGALGKWLQRSARTQIVMNRVAGAIFVALALRLLATER